MLLIEDSLRERARMVTAELQRVADQIDGLWHESLAAGSGQAIALGEANQSVHRALLALNMQHASTSVLYVTEWA